MAIVHITHINDSLANIRANIDAYQSAVATDNDSFWLHSDEGTNVYFGIANKLLNIATGEYTFLNAEFNDITAQGDILSEEGITHRGDLDTGVVFFSDDFIRTRAGGKTAFDIDGLNAILQVNPDSTFVSVTLNNNVSFKPSVGILLGDQDVQTHTRMIQAQLEDDTNEFIPIRLAKYSINSAQNKLSIEFVSEASSSDCSWQPIDRTGKLTYIPGAGSVEPRFEFTHSLSAKSLYAYTYNEIDGVQGKYLYLNLNSSISSNIDGAVNVYGLTSITLQSAALRAIGMDASAQSTFRSDIGAASSGHNHSGVYDPAGTAAAAVSAHVSASDPHTQYHTDARGDARYSLLGHGHSQLHDAVTIADSTSIDLSLTGQQISAAAIFGTTAGTVCQGNDARLSDARVPLAHNQAWSTITATPTTLAGYGITDAAPLTHGVTANYLARATSTTAWGNSLIQDNGSAIIIGGSVGIGTSDPQSLLDCSAGGGLFYSLRITSNAGLRIDSGYTDDYMLITKDSTGPVFNSIGNTVYRFLTNNGDRVTVDTNGIDVIGRIIVDQDNTANSKNVYIHHTGTVGYVETSYKGAGGYTPLAFATSGVERVRITSAGNVGIGCAPSYLLHVYGGDFVIGNATVSASYTYNSIGAQIGSLSNHPTLIYANGSEKMRITSDGNVGIGGTPDTNANLHIIDASGQAELWLERTGYAATKLIGSTLSDGNGFRMIVNGADVFSVDSAGRIGIGNTSPANYDPLARNLVIGSSGNSGLSIVSSTTGFGSVNFADGTSGTETYRGCLLYDHTQDQMQIWTSGASRIAVSSTGATAINYNLRIGSVGAPGSGSLSVENNVGIGTPPGTWGASLRAIQWSRSAIYAPNDNEGITIASNLRHDGTDTHYLSDGAAAAVTINNDRVQMVYATTGQSGDVANVGVFAYFDPDDGFYFGGTGAVGVGVAPDGSTAKLNVNGSIKATISALATSASAFVVSDGGVLKSRSAANMRSDLGLAISSGSIPYAVSGGAFNDSPLSVSAGAKIYFNGGATTDYMMEIVQLWSTGHCLKLYCSDGASNVLNVNDGNLVVKNSGSLATLGPVGIGTSNFITSNGYGTQTINGSNGGMINLATSDSFVARWYNTSDSSVFDVVSGGRYSFNVNNVEKLRISPQGDIIADAVMMTHEGGFAVLCVAGENLVLGEVVCFKQGSTAGRVYKAPTSGNSIDMPIGVVYASANSGQNVWIVKSGRCKVLPESGITATFGYVISCSTSTAGRVTQEATPSTVQHWRECGHWEQNGGGAGEATDAFVHFN